MILKFAINAVFVLYYTCVFVLNSAVFTSVYCQCCQCLTDSFIENVFCLTNVEEWWHALVFCLFFFLHLASSRIRGESLTHYLNANYSLGAVA